MINIQSKVRKIALFSVLTALSAIFGYFDRLICQSVFPSALLFLRLGLANIVIIVIIFRFNLAQSLLAGTLKSVFASMLFASSGLTTFVISICGTILSILLMYFVKKTLKGEKYIVITSVVGGFFHPLGQLVGVFILYRSVEMIIANIIYMPILLIIGIITGFILGNVARKTYNVLEKYNY